ncbi:ImmA/IrrE family metallo-endopeptidase [Leucobacter aridicollis]|uniref:ImmA/IrrE family metallo-endopeptidase n=1 Tax=Leucobacter aridicollis TaxID=283878 RepID=UPI002168E16E|nr:ImmA/IrrE family metallo-endopeptidase [Leucobacter aridicollis]
MDVRMHAKFNAEGVLEAHWDGTLPVDPAVIASRVGVEVFNAQLGNDVYGILQRKLGGRPQIFLDHDQPVNRWRFSCAHELGHYIDRSARLDEEIEYIERRSDANRFSNDEVFANEFAGNLLMPEADIRARAAAGMSAYELAQTFGVSLDAVLYRKKILGLD